MLGYRAVIMAAHQGKSLTQYAIIMTDGRAPSCDDPKNGFTLGFRTIFREELGMSVKAIADFYSQTKTGQELMHRAEAEGERKGLRRGLAQTLEILLRDRFGDQPEIAEIAGQLAQTDDLPDAVHRVTNVKSLDGLRRELRPETRSA